MSTEDTDQASSSGVDPSSAIPTSTLIDEAYEEYAAAQKSLDIALGSQAETQGDAEFFRRNNHLGDVVDEMTSRLQS